MTVHPARAEAAQIAADELTAISAVLSRLAGAASGAVDWSAAERHTALSRLDHAVDTLTAIRATVLLAERESATWQGRGDRSFEAWRGRVTRTGQRSAAAQVRQAERIGALPAVASAVVDGRISVDHAAVIGQVASSGTPAQRSAAQSSAGQEHLLALAQQLDAGSFGTTVTEWAATVDPAGLEKDHEAQRAERYLHVTHTPRGTHIKGQLDTIAGHRLTLALEALTPRPAVDDERDAGQRRADALEAMVTRTLASPDTKPGGHVPPQISMILSEETWVAARAERNRRRRRAASGVPGGDPHAEGVPATADFAVAQSAGVGQAGIEPAVDGSAKAGYAPATLEDGTPVPATVLAAAMCDCEITRIVIDADGVPLDVGRAERLFTAQQRRAVIARDRECAWPECHAPARWCEVHHVLWWERDAGPTSVDNGVLLCSFHHHEVHRRDLTITRIPARNDGEPPGKRPRHHTGAQVRYAFRELSGRVLGGGRDAHRTASVSATASGVERAPVLAPPAAMAALGGALRDPPSQRSSAPGGSDSAAEPPLTWSTDPVTGVKVPDMLLWP